MLPSLLDRLGPLSLAEVTAVDDPDGLGRVEIRPLARQGHDGQSATLWARVAVPFAGESRGAFLLPDVGDEVLIAFLGGDPRFPVVLGSFWNSTGRANATPGNRRATPKTNTVKPAKKRNGENIRNLPLKNAGCGMRDAGWKKKRGDGCHDARF